MISRLEDADYEGHSLSLLSRIADAMQRRLTIAVTPIEGGNARGNATVLTP